MNATPKGCNEMSKKTGAKAQPKAKKKAVKSVVAEVPAQDETQAPVQGEAVPTPGEFVRSAQKSASEAIAKIEACGYALEDGISFFDGFEEERRKELIKGIAGYLEKAHFAACSLRDEITIALGEQPGAKKAQTLPKLVLDTPSVPKDVVAPASAEKPLVAVLEQSQTLFELTLIMLSEMEITGAQAERAVQVIEFQRRMLTDTKAALASVKGAA